MKNWCTKNHTNNNLLLFKNKVVFLYFTLNLALMKFLYTLLLSLTSFGAFAQYSIYQNFETPNDDFRTNFYIDTVNCSNNLWQIGRPQKAFFDSAYSYPNAIVTDTLNQYPVNDTSIFYLTMAGSYHALLSLSFYFKLDIDTLATAKMELSGDGGLNWINPITEDTTFMFYWVGGKPRFDTSTTGWRKFDLNMDTWSQSYPGSHFSFPHYRTSDTIIYRFTFITGDSLVHHDGWIMDNFRGLNTARVGMDKVEEISSVIFPNPSNGTIFLRPNFRGTAEDRIVVYDMHGQQVYEAVPFGSLPINLPLSDGVYTVKYIGVSGVTTNRVVIIK
jgi:hypothetical protein